MGNQCIKVPFKRKIYQRHLGWQDIGRYWLASHKITRPKSVALIKNKNNSQQLSQQFPLDGGVDSQNFKRAYLCPGMGYKQASSYSKAHVPFLSTRWR